MRTGEFPGGRDKFTDTTTEDSTKHLYKTLCRDTCLLSLDVRPGYPFYNVWSHVCGLERFCSFSLLHLDFNRTSFRIQSC